MCQSRLFGAALIVLSFWSASANSAIVNTSFTLIATGGFYSGLPSGINVGDSTDGVFSYDNDSLIISSTGDGIRYNAQILSISINPLSGYSIPSYAPNPNWVVLGADQQTIVSFNLLLSNYNESPTFWANSGLAWDYSIRSYSSDLRAHGIFQFDNASNNPVPLPAAFWLFGSGLIGLIGFTKK